MSGKKEKKWNVEDAAEKAGEDIGRGLKNIGEAVEKAGRDVERGLNEGWDKGQTRTKKAVTEGKGKDKKED